MFNNDHRVSSNIQINVLLKMKKENIKRISNVNLK